MELFKRYRELPMPNLQLNDIDVAAVIDYMEKENERRAPAPATEHAHHQHH